MTTLPGDVRVIDVAYKADADLRTVRRMLQGRPGRPGVRRRIRRALRELGVELTDSPPAAPRSGGDRGR
jgi:hypothetical protein